MTLNGLKIMFTQQQLSNGIFLKINQNVKNTFVKFESVPIGQLYLIVQT